MSFDVRLLLPALRAASAGVLVGVPLLAAWTGVEIHRQQWLPHGLLFVAASAIADSLARAVLYGAVFGVGLHASAQATTPRAMPLPARLAALAGSWLFLLFPLTVVLAPSARQLLLEHMYGSLAMRMLAVIPLNWLPSACVWALTLRLAWMARSASEARHPGRARAWTGRAADPRWGLLLAALATVTGLGVRAAWPPPPSDSRNIVLVVVDTLRADRVGAYGYAKRSTSPNVDRFAADSVLFESAASTAPWTTPSVAAMLTGRYPRRHGFNTVPSRLPPQEVSIAEVFLEHGYRTYAVVANMCASRATSFDSGFESMDESQLRDLHYVSSGGVTDRAIEWLRKVHGQRFFLYVHYIDPHFPYSMHSDYEFDPGYQGEFRHLSTFNQLQDRIPTMKPADFEFVLASYDSEIAKADAAVGRLLDEMKALGVYDDALIVFVSDHGEAFDDRHDQFIGHGEKVFEELLHVPLIVKYPGGRGAGTRVTDRVSTLDVAPTILGTAGLSFPRGIAIDGKNLGEGFVPRAVFSQNYHHQKRSAVYDGPWKLHVDHDADARMLFDLASDPGELSNREPDHGELSHRLSDELQRWEAALGEAEDGGFGFSEAGKEKLRALGYLQ